MKKPVLILIIILLPAILQAQSTFTGDRIEDAVVNYIEQNTDGETKVTLLSDIDDLEFAESGITASFYCNPELMRGFSKIEVLFYDENKLLKKLVVPVRIQIYRKVAVATHDLGKGTVITSADITLESVDVTDYFATDLPDYRGLQGQTITRRVLKGSPVTMEALKQHHTINRGDVVQINVIAGTVRIKALGTALNDAASGEKVRLEREGTRQIIQGTVAADGNVYLMRHR